MLLGKNVYNLLLTGFFSCRRTRPSKTAPLQLQSNIEPLYETNVIPTLPIEQNKAEKKPKGSIKRTSFHNPINFFRAAASQTVMMAATAAVAKADCDKNPLYFTARQDDGTLGFYAVKVNGVFYDACSWAFTALHNRVCNITNVNITGRLISTIGSYCSVDDQGGVYLGFHGETLTLATVGNTTTALSESLKCFIGQLKNQCHGSNSIMPFVIIICSLFGGLPLVICCLVRKRKMYESGRDILRFIGDRYNEYCARKVEKEIIQIFMDANGLKPIVQHIAEYADFMPITLKEEKTVAISRSPSPTERTLIVSQRGSVKYLSLDNGDETEDLEEQRLPPSRLQLNG